MDEAELLDCDSHQAFVRLYDGSGSIVSVLKLTFSDHCQPVRPKKLLIIEEQVHLYGRH